MFNRVLFLLCIPMCVLRWKRDTLSKKVYLFVHKEEGIAIVSGCIITLLITLNRNRVTAQPKQTRLPLGILLCPFLYFLVFCLCPLSSAIFSILPLAVLFSLCQGRLVAGSASLLSPLISTCAKSRGAVCQSHCLLCALCFNPFPSMPALKQHEHTQNSSMSVISFSFF